MASRCSSGYLPEHKSRKTKQTLITHGRLWQPSTRQPKSISFKRNEQEEEVIQRIRETFDKKVELSVSSYDTAWVAMVPSRGSPRSPSFPRCLDWIKENQLPDGSWSLIPSHPLLVKDRLSSTLACILALETWDDGKFLVQKGLDFIQSNSWAAQDKQQYSPIGFDIVFPYMISFSKELGLRLPLESSMVEGMLRNRELGIERSHEGKSGDLAYVAEGFGEQLDWKEVMVNHQRSNGSLLNSPSTTAAALTHLHDEKCHRYLHSLLQEYEHGVPAIYPFNIYPRLKMVESLGLGRLGVDQYFKNEVKIVLDETYRCWMQRNEEMVSDPKCYAMAFRLLRLNGYDVSAEEALAKFDEKANFFKSVSAQFTEPCTIIELYRASQIKIFQEEPILEKIEAWTSTFLKQQISNKEIQNQVFREEVEYVLAHPRGRWERAEVRRYIERYCAKDYDLAKTSYRYSSSNNKDLLAFAQKRFNDNQSIYQEEIKHVERWLKDTRLEQLSSVRKRVPSTVFTVAGAGLYHPELSEARHSWTKNGILATIMDDFFDVACTKEELINLTEKLVRWDEHSAIEFSSEQVEILFYAIYNTTNEYIAKASGEQGRSVKDHLKLLFLELATHMMKEFDWQIEEKWPDFEEYLSNGWITIALKPVVLNALYQLGATLSKEAVESEEYYNLCKHMSIIGRLLNDIATFKREDGEGKLNSLSLYRSHVSRVLSPDEVTSEIKKIIDRSRRELLRMVVQSEGSLVPKSCKDLFWTASETLHNLYSGIDGFSLVNTIIDDINATIYDPIVLPENEEYTRS